MINFRLMRHLWLFLAVAEEQNFGRAARRLGMSQPPLTEQIQVLEHALKVRLFERSRRGTQLTAVGQAIVPAVRKFVDQMEQLELAVREATAGQTGTLTIGAITSAMVEILPPLLVKLRSLHPQLTIAVREIDSADAVPALLAGDVDLAFPRLHGELGETIEILTLADDRLGVALPPGHRLANRRSVRLGDLSDEAFVMFSRRVSPVYFDRIIVACRENNFSPRILYEVRTVAAQVAFVGCGQGVALVPMSLRQLAFGNVVVRPLAEKIDVVTTAAAWSNARNNPSLTLALEVLRELPRLSGRKQAAPRKRSQSTSKSGSP